MTHTPDNYFWSECVAQRLTISSFLEHVGFKTDGRSAAQLRLRKEVDLARRRFHKDPTLSPFIGTFIDSVDDEVKQIESAPGSHPTFDSFFTRLEEEVLITAQAGQRHVLAGAELVDSLKKRKISNVINLPKSKKCRADYDIDYSDDESVDLDPLIVPMQLFAQKSDELDAVIEEQKRILLTAKSPEDCTHPLYRKIIDLCPNGDRAYLSASTEMFIRAKVDKVLGDFWDTSQNSALQAFLDHMAALPTATLLDLGREVLDKGRVWAADAIRVAKPSPHARGVRRRHSLSQTSLSDENWRALKSNTDSWNSVQYVIDLLVVSVKAIDKNTRARPNTERDLDIKFHHTAFSVLDGVLDDHFGEAESRASRRRRQDAATQAGLCGKRIRGSFLDWLFVDESLQTDDAWGLEISAAANAGARRSQEGKFVKDRLGLQLVLRDIFLMIAKRVMDCRKHSQAAASEIARLPITGVLITVMRYRILTNVYIGKGLYASVQLADFDAPVSNTPRFGEQLRCMVLNMLAFRNLQEKVTDDISFLLDTTRQLDDSVDLLNDQIRWQEHALERTIRKETRIAPSKMSLP
ncbi:hypothetical protein BC832DRAFT_542843 [Gaertneriomyces semiglobifer]|nr:hypothetical protein BC832DRAFT_542843 [Gaertneriomyces semiglobifer]